MFYPMQVYKIHLKTLGALSRGLDFPVVSDYGTHESCPGGG